jgi:hypothetical protein
VEAGTFAHACEGEAVVKLTHEKVRLQTRIASVYRLT